MSGKQRGDSVQAHSAGIPSSHTAEPRVRGAGGGSADPVCLPTWGRTGGWEADTCEVSPGSPARPRSEPSPQAA